MQKNERKFAIKKIVDVVDFVFFFFYLHGTPIPCEAL